MSVQLWTSQDNTQRRAQVLQGCAIGRNTVYGSIIMQKTPQRSDTFRKNRVCMVFCLRQYRVWAVLCRVPARLPLCEEPQLQGSAVWWWPWWQEGTGHGGTAHCHAAGCGQLKMHAWNKVNISIFQIAEQTYNTLVFIVFLRLCLEVYSGVLGDSKNYRSQQSLKRLAWSTIEMP